MEARHRAVLTDLHAGLSQQSDRMQTQLAALQIAQGRALAETRETVTASSAIPDRDAGKAHRTRACRAKPAAGHLKHMTAQFSERAQQLSQTVDGRPE